MALLFALAAAGYGAACAGPPACEINSDCNDGECKVDCVDAEQDCPRGYFCNIVAQCEMGEGGSGNGPGAGGGGSGAQGGAGGTGAQGGSGGTGAQGGGGSPGTLGELDLCGAGDCASGLTCRALVVGGPERCTRSCSSDDECMQGTRCIDDLCLGDDIGRTCSAAASCNFACITGPNYCTAECQSGDDCPNGYGCMPVGSPAIDVCVRAEALCGPGDTAACIAPAACDLSPNLILGSCTTVCDTAADCPQRAAPLAPWTCDAGGICRRPGDVYGPLPGGFQPTEWHCDGSFNPVVLCNDAQHIDFIGFTIPPAPSVDCGASVTTTGAANDACVDSCRYDGGCAHDFACVAVGGISGQRIGLCLPTGNLEPGAGCSNDTQCAFGYCSNGSCSRDCTLDGICPNGTTCTAAGGPPIEGQPFRRCE
jgi:hypothetical protein